MTIKVGINGFGRIGRLVFRILADWHKETPKIEVVRINDPAGDAAGLAHLTNFDSVHGRWSQRLESRGANLYTAQQSIEFSQQRRIEDTDWRNCDIVIEASGAFRSSASLTPYFDQGVSRVLVTAPVKDSAVANIVVGVNHHQFDFAQHPIVTAASCTTNCLAPIVQVIDNEFGIAHGSITTIHALTNTQTILDAAHKDARRARACSMSMIPTTTGSATAITRIFPHLKGKLNGHAVRVPLTNPSLIDCVFELKQPVNREQVNAALKLASISPELDGILGFEERPLVSIDFRGDPRSCIIDALSTMVIGDTQLKLYAWYDNEWGYANRTAELLRMIAGQ